MASQITWQNLESWLDTSLSSPIKDLGPPQPESFFTDSRSVKERGWFIPIKGVHFDGHQFIEQALQKGAQGFLFEKGSAGALSGEVRKRGIEVPDTLGAYQKIAQGWRALVKTPLIGITGSSGKTTVKELTSHTLKSQFRTLSTEANYNNEIGVPKTLLQLTDDHEMGVLEFGARHQGDIKLLTEMASPNITCLLNVGRAHLGEFGSVETLRSTKLEIYRTAPPTATLVVPIDDDLICQAIKGAPQKILTFGYHESSDVRAIDHKPMGHQGEVRLQFQGSHEISIRLPFYHTHNGINAAAAAALCFAAGMTPRDIGLHLGKVQGPPGRFKVHQLSHMTLIDDSYNANPESTTAGLETLSSGFRQRQLILVLGDMLELGPESIEAHQRIGAVVAKLNPEFLATVGDHSRYIQEKAISLGLSKAKAQHFKDSNELKNNYYKIKELGDLMYVKGSNSINLSSLVTHVLSQEPIAKED